MTKLRETMQQQEQRHLWSMRWLIVGAFVQAAAVLYLALGADGRAMVPAWAFYLWGLLALAVASLAGLAKAMRPPGGMLDLPLGPAYVAPLPSVIRRNIADRLETPPAADVSDGAAIPIGHATMAHQAPLVADPTPPGAYTPHPDTPTSPETLAPAPNPPPDPDITPIPVPEPPAPPSPNDPAPKR